MGSGVRSGGFVMNEAPSFIVSAPTPASAETASWRGPRGWRSGSRASTGSRSTTTLQPVAGSPGRNASSVTSRRARSVAG